MQIVLFNPLIGPDQMLPFRFDYFHMFGVLVGFVPRMFLFDISEYFTASIIFFASGNLMSFVHFILMISFPPFPDFTISEICRVIFSAEIFLLTVHVFCVVFATSSAHWGSSASVLMMSEPLAFETSVLGMYASTFIFIYPTLISEGGFGVLKSYM